MTGRKLGFRHPLLERSPSNQLCKHLGLTSSGTIIWEFAKKPEPVIQFLFTPPSFPATGAPDFPNGPRAGPAGLGGVTGPELFLCGLMPGGASLSPGFYYRRCRFQEGMPSLPASPSKFLCWLLLRTGITTIPWVDVVPRMPLCPVSSWEHGKYHGAVCIHVVLTLYEMSRLLFCVSSCHHL